MPQASHGQNDPDALSVGAASITLSVAVIVVGLEPLGSGKGVTESLGAGPVTALALGCGETGVTVRGAGAELRAGTVRPIGGELDVVAGPLGTGLALATGTGLGVGVGRTSGARTTGLSASTGPCERGLLVGRAPGSEKSGNVCAAAIPGTSAAASATAPVAALMLPPIIRISRSIPLRSGALAPPALNRK